jgi:hypothetical protein
LPTTCQNAEDQPTTEHESQEQTTIHTAPDDPSEAWVLHKKLRRFSPFVTSGAEEYVLSGCCTDIPKELSTEWSLAKTVTSAIVHPLSPSIRILSRNELQVRDQPDQSVQEQHRPLSDLNFIG